MLVAFLLFVSIGICADSYPPGIGSFVVSSNPTKIGQSTTLSWYVYGAKTITIDHGIGNVKFVGTKIVYPTTDTVYRLTATNDAGSVSAIAVCNVMQQQPSTITLANIFSEGGRVWSGNWNYGLDLGDTNENSGSQVFLSFDISNIPPNSSIKDVIVDFSGSQIVSGDPFANLGCLGGYSVDFGNHIDPADYSSRVDYSSAALVFCSPSDLRATQSQSNLVNSIQNKLGNSRFQLRLQFPEKESNGDGVSDMIDLGYVNRLIVTIDPKGNGTMPGRAKIPWMGTVLVVPRNSDNVTYIHSGTFLAPPRNLSNVSGGTFLSPPGNMANLSRNITNWIL